MSLLCALICMSLLATAHTAHVDVSSWYEAAGPFNTGEVSLALQFPSSPTLLKAHAIFMSLAWVFFAPIGVMIARYWRADWPEQREKGRVIWFQAHRILQSCTVICTLLGIICIFTYVGGYDPQIERSNILWQAHPVIGIVILCLIILNPTLALLRPRKQSDWRPYFRLSHMLIGRLACILAIFNIFVGLSMYQSSWVSYDWWNEVLGAFVIFHILMEIMLTFLTQNKPDPSLADVDETKRLLGTGGPKSGIRKLLIGFYGMISFSVILVIIISCVRTDT